MLCAAAPADVEEEVEEGYSFSEATRGWCGDDAVLVMRLYSAVVAAAKAAMQHFALTVSGGRSVCGGEAGALGVLPVGDGRSIRLWINTQRKAL